MHNLSSRISNDHGEISIWIKRDDCTGLGAGGNKVRQLEFYVGDAVAQSADTLLTTGAIQSNHVRMTVAAARKLGMHCEVQLEHRVADRPQQYYRSGNPFLVHLMGANIHYFAEGEDEEGADQALVNRAEQLRADGKKPYVVKLAGTHHPIGAFGYMLAAQELLEQAGDFNIDAIVLASGSGATHAGMLMGLRYLGSNAKVYGICVRRTAQLQRQRIIERCKNLAKMLELSFNIGEKDILLTDSELAPGYGQLNDSTYEAIFTTAYDEGIFLDPTYTGKAMAGLFKLAAKDTFTPGQNIVFLHTGGLPGIFGYPELLDYELSEGGHREKDRALQPQLS